MFKKTVLITASIFFSYSVLAEKVPFRVLEEETRPFTMGISSQITMVSHKCLSMYLAKESISGDLMRYELAVKNNIENPMTEYPYPKLLKESRASKARLEKLISLEKCAIIGIDGGKYEILNLVE